MSIVWMIIYVYLIMVLSISEFTIHSHLMSAYFQLGFSGYGAMGAGQFDQPTTGKKEIVGM